MPAPPKSSLVGRAPPLVAPGRGDAGERPPWIPTGRMEVGPMEARKLGDLPAALPPGAGETLGLGGARLDMFRYC